MIHLFQERLITSGMASVPLHCHSTGLPWMLARPDARWPPNSEHVGTCRRLSSPRASAAISYDRWSRTAGKSVYPADQRVLALRFKLCPTFQHAERNPVHAERFPCLTELLSSSIDPSSQSCDHHCLLSSQSLARIYICPAYMQLTLLQIAISWRFLQGRATR